MSAAGAPGGAAFDAGVKEIAARNWDTALDLLESALTADPDNLRYGNEYRRAVILRAQTLHPGEGRPEDFDRSIKFFAHLVEKNPAAANAYVNYGLAYVDKLPCLDALSRMSEANTAVTEFTKSLELRPSWVGYFTRGVSYLFWPKFFGRAKLGVADLEAAVKLQSSGPKKAYQSETWLALGDGYWKLDDLEKARAAWSEGLKEFPGTAALQERLAEHGEELKTQIQHALDPRKRVNTNLEGLWQDH